MPYYFDSRVIFQTRSKFWAKDGVSPNMEINEDALQHVWSTCDEVDSARGLLVGTATGAGSPEAALASYRKHYTGPSEDIEKSQVHVWLKNPWASACETTSYPVGAAREVLAGALRAGRPRALRRRLRRQPELGDGSRDAVGQSRCRGHRVLRDGRRRSATRETAP